MTKNEFKRFIKEIVGEYIVSNHPHVSGCGYKNKLDSSDILEESYKDSLFIPHKDWVVHKDIFRKQISVNLMETGDKLQFEISDAGIYKNDGTNDNKLYNHLTKAARAWVNEAKQIYNNPETDSVGNANKLSWKKCFELALKNDNVRKYIKKATPIVDPVNFSYHV